MPQDDGPKPINVRLIIDNAREVEPKSEPTTAGPKSSTGKSAKAAAPPADGGDGERHGFNLEGLPEDCPVIPLGENGRVCYYLDAGMHLWELGAHEHNRLHIMRMFGDKTDFLYRHWPRKTQDKDKVWHVTGWKPEGAAEALSAACSRLGDWDAAKKVRGAGAWKGDDGKLILHCGDVILMGADQHKPGFHGGHVYPASPALPRLWPGPVAADDNGPGAFLLQLFRCWNWGRGDLDARLLLGAVACGMIGGALKWRPMVWVTGGTGTGKSTLRNSIEDLYAGRLVACEDPSPAGLWQTLGHQTLAIAVDEHEPDELDQSRRPESVVKLARLAASGAMMLRGGADHKSVEFVIRSCFMFFSILIPPLSPQNRNRLAILSLGQLRAEAAPELEPAKLREVGQKLLRRLVDGWPSWGAVHHVFHNALMAEHLNSRTADVYAALLTAAELVCADDHSDLAEYANTIALQIAGFSLGEMGDDAPDENRCLAFLLSSMLPLESGAVKRPVLEYIRRVMLGEPHSDSTRDAKAMLMNYGLKVVYYRVGAERFPFLAVAFNHRELSKVFHGTHWAARSGTNGVWKQSLERLPGAERSRNPIWFTGANLRAVLVPMRAIFPPEGDPKVAVTEGESDTVAGFESDD